MRCALRGRDWRFTRPPPARWVAAGSVLRALLEVYVCCVETQTAGSMDDAGFEQRGRGGRGSCMRLVLMRCKCTCTCRVVAGSSFGHPLLITSPIQSAFNLALSHALSHLSIGICDMTILNNNMCPVTADPARCRADPGRRARISRRACLNRLICAILRQPHGSGSHERVRYGDKQG